MTITTPVAAASERSSMTVAHPRPLHRDGCVTR